MSPREYEGWFLVSLWVIFGLWCAPVTLLSYFNSGDYNTRGVLDPAPMLIHINLSAHAEKINISTLSLFCSTFTSCQRHQILQCIISLVIDTSESSYLSDIHEANDDLTGLLEKVKFDSRGGWSCYFEGGVAAKDIRVAKV